MTASRRLAAILAADVVGYSRLMGEDEAGTAQSVREHREAATPLVRSHGGRIVKTMGDGVLLEFPSVVAAVECAIAIQKLMTERNAGVPDEKRILYRMGVHIGDVIVEGDDILGDGVNIAARLEGIAEPGGVCLSASAHEHVQGRIKADFTDLGEKQLKNIARPVRVYQTSLVSKSKIDLSERPSLPLPDRPSIAVLPFQNMSGDPEQEYFADGMVEDIVTGLSRIKWLFVTARNSSFTYKGKAVDVRQVGRELGVRYVLEGGVRKSGTRLRVTAQLVEAETGAHLWADKFDGALEDVFDLQDQITDRLVGIVEPSLQRSEVERSRRKRPESLDAHDLYLRALPYVSPISPANAPTATEYLLKALELEPNYPAAHAYLAWAHLIHFAHGGGFDEADKIAGLRHARAALANDVDYATALAVGANVAGFLGKDAKAALNAIERALSCNPSSAIAYYFGSTLYAWSGDPVVGTTCAHRALRLSPFDPLIFQAHVALAIAAFQEERYDESAAWWAKCQEANPDFGGFVMGEASALALGGRTGEARAACARGLKLEPGFSIHTQRQLGFALAIEAKFVQAYRLLGVPEK
jgi:TolB-like protein/class 3 adenylate cyclase